MRIHFLGTAGYHPNETRHTSCFAIPEAGIMLDAGTGVFRLPPLLQTDQLEILLSHAHLDHVVGLTFLLGISAIKPLKRVRVWGEAEKLEAVRTHLFHELLFPVLPEWLEFQPLPKSTFSLAGARVRYQPLTHPGGSVGYRLDWPKSSLAYITDTVADATAEYISLIRGVDLLIHECNFTREEKQFAQTTGHSWDDAVGRVAATAHARRLVLTHFSPYASAQAPIDIQRVRHFFPHAELGHDGLVVEF